MLLRSRKATSAIAELVEQYVSLPLGIVDAAVIAIAERLNLTEVATVDRKHFSIVRPRHVSAFRLLPEALESTHALRRLRATARALPPNRLIIVATNCSLDGTRSDRRMSCHPLP